jgi:hypothetical protein
MAHFLRRSVGAWSSGTRVEILSRKGNELEIRVLAGDRPVIFVDKNDVVTRGRKGKRED